MTNIQSNTIFQCLNTSKDILQLFLPITLTLTMYVHTCIFKDVTKHVPIAKFEQFRYVGPDFITNFEHNSMT